MQNSDGGRGCSGGGDISRCKGSEAGMSQAFAS